MATKSTKGRTRRVMATTKANGNKAPAEVNGPHVPLVLYFRHYRHWCGPEHNGEPRPMDRQFLELEREGIDCLYRNLNALVEEIYPHGRHMRRPTTAPNLGRWGDMRREHAEVKRAWAMNNGAVVHRVGPMLPTDPKGYAAPYGATYARAHHQSVHEVMVPHVVTSEEAERDGIPNAAGLTAWTCDPTQCTTATAEQVGRRWAEVYAEEVRHLLGDEPNDGTLAAFAHLHANLKGYPIGTKEGARVMERMKAEGMGAEVLAAFGRIREHLNALLTVVAEEHLGQTETNSDRITWRGMPGELAEVFHQLAANGWIEVPARGRVKLAARILAMFKDRDGNDFDAKTFAKYMQPGAHRPTNPGWKFEVNKRPDPRE